MLCKYYGIVSIVIRRKWKGRLHVEQKKAEVEVSSCIISIMHCNSCTECGCEQNVDDTNNIQ